MRECKFCGGDVVDAELYDYYTRAGIYARLAYEKERADKAESETARLLEIHRDVCVMLEAVRMDKRNLEALLKRIENGLIEIIRVHGGKPGRYTAYDEDILEIIEELRDTHE